MSPAGEWESFLAPPVRFFPCGRLHEVPQYLRLAVTWTASPPALPPDDQAALFTSVVFYRQLLRQFAGYPLIADWVTNTGPSLEYLMAHWRSQLSSATIPAFADDSSSGLWNTRWYLFYGDYSGLDPIQFLDPPIDQTQASFFLQDVDSGGSPASPSGDPPVFQGWTLALVHKYFTVQSDPTAPPLVAYVVHGAWTLYQPDSPAPLSIFDPKVPSTWTMFSNNLNFPQNLLTLTPWQP